ncbi:hypothetical protein [Rhizobium terrae]|uniref:hypothetical protein n=1 Tax=Rhizobium terrae TaxID=2171756 RepID=UPI000E3D2ACF|nr:hypothetical protein [Rhizobium terrae]
MPMTAQQIADHALIVPLIKQQSAAMQQAYAANPRMSSVFATQQRWLLAHAAMGLLFRSMAGGKPMMTLSGFLALVAEHSISSRNTADAFAKEMLHYGYMTLLEEASDRRSRPMAISKMALEGIIGWAATHLNTLDQLDGGRRLEVFLASDGAIFRLEPEIADGLLVHPSIRQPQDTFSLFTWLNNGGVIMDWLITGLGEISDDGRRYPTSVGSIADMAGWLKLSRTHLARKLNEAEAMGSLGWSGRRGDSAMWVSAGFVREIIKANAAKLAVIDAAFERSFGR